MAAVDVKSLSYRYGRKDALCDLDLSIPEGSVYALLGPNGAGKTTLLQILMGIRKYGKGHVAVLGKDSNRLIPADRARMGYVAEGQELPKWMRIEQLEAFLAPLYPTWDAALARDLRQRFHLDPKQKIKTLSRGEYMKAALLCALAPRPKLLLMDEPFTGMDVMVRDELVRGLLGTADSEGWTVVISSHDLGEIEMLCDWIGFLDRGRMLVSDSVESIQRRYRRVEVTLAEPGAASMTLPANWLSVDRSGARLSFVTSGAAEDFEGSVRQALPDASRIDVRDVSLRELFLALATAPLPATVAA